MTITYDPGTDIAKATRDGAEPPEDSSNMLIVGMIVAGIAWAMMG